MNAPAPYVMHTEQGRSAFPPSHQRQRSNGGFSPNASAAMTAFPATPAQRPGVNSMQGRESAGHLDIANITCRGVGKSRCCLLPRRDPAAVWAMDFRSADTIDP
ncbi:hypothetical protein JOF48_000373 [Arthrobacter stackebrandtii]|uniref:Uncharacterized protein n=1 Tax=Arthrobacter stackebrandtii TaxID=272161 RepID=A0ABS4YS31_9MICC|nr:hypothetical protein [Arthrobacter stackebrandtii]MBP2411574.1 hypothetical protein [Arthrobacter stackebrandtii]